MKNCVIAQSGGPTSAINASLAGVINKALHSSKIDIIYGAINGIEGVINNTLINLNDMMTTLNSYEEILKTTPAMFLGSCRYKLPTYEKDNKLYEKICNNLIRKRIKYFFYIGGNDSMDTVDKLSIYAERNKLDIQFIGIAKTIDNDLFGTDHTPGFGSAAKYIATSILEIAHDANIYNLKSVTIVEIMGRNAGWLTAASALARNSYNTSPELIYLPEVPFSIEKFIIDVKEKLKIKNNIIIAVSEGIKNKDGEYIAASKNYNDSFGHANLNGIAKVLEKEVKEHIKCKVRSIELNVLQRCSSHIASLTDIEEAYKMGQKAVECAINGDTGKMMIFKRVDSDKYDIKIDSIDVRGVANKEKKVPIEWISSDKNDVKEEMIRYIGPLINGEINIKYNEGLPIYMEYLNV